MFSTVQGHFNHFVAPSSYAIPDDPKSLKSLDLNHFDKTNMGVFPYDIYKGDVMPFYNAPCDDASMMADKSTVRDSRSAYFINGEVTKHPSFSTVFWQNNGWDKGYQTGTTVFGFQTATPWQRTTEPAGVAPPSMYVCDADYEASYGKPPIRHKFLSDCVPAQGGSSRISRAYAMQEEGKMYFSDGKGFCTTGRKLW